MTDNVIAAFLIHYLMNNTPFYLSSRLAEIFWNFNGENESDILISMKEIFGPIDQHRLYEAAQYAHDAMAAY